MNFLQRMAARVSRAVPETWLQPAESDRSMGIQPGTAITPATIAGALRSARYGDTRSLSGIKAEMRATDADLESHIAKLEGRLSQAPIEITPVTEDPRAEEVAAYCREQLLDPDLMLSSVIRHALWGLLDGVAGFQVVVRPDGPRFRLVTLDRVPSERFFWPSGSTELHVQPGNDIGTYVPVTTLGDACAVLVVEQHQLSRDRVGLLRRCIPPWLTKLNGFGWWARAVELTGIPYRKVKYRSGVNLTNLEAQVKAMGTAGYGLFPDGVDLEFISQALGSRNAHEDLVGYCDREKAKVLLGATQTADIQAGSGSKSSAEVHERILEETVDGYGREIAAFIRAKVLKPLVRLSFGEEAAERLTPMPFLAVRGNADLESLFGALKLAGEAGVRTIPVAWVHAQAGIPMPKDGEAVLLPGGAVAEGAPGGTEEPEDDAEAPEELGEPEAHSARPASPAGGLAAAEAWAMRQAKGAGEEIVAPLRSLIDEAERDGATLAQLLARVIQRSGLPPSSPKLMDLLTAVQLEATMRGWTEARG